MHTDLICKLCDKSIKIRCKKKHLNSRYHEFLGTSIICSSIIKNPDFLQKEDILKNYNLDYNKKFIFSLILCRWKSHFSDTIVTVKNDKWWCSLSAGFYLRNFLLSKIIFLERPGHLFSHISAMNITFISDLKNITYEHYLSIPKSMMEWKFNILLAKNPKLLRIFENSTHPLKRKYNRTNEDDGEN